MKRLLLFAVFCLSFTVCDIARSQIQFDSVTVQIQNIVNWVDLDYEDMSGSWITFHGYDTLNMFRSDKIVNDSTSGDSLILSFNPGGSKYSYGSIIFVIDTFTNSINMLKYAYLSDIGYGQTWSNFTLQNVSMIRFLNGFQISIEGAIIDSTNFDYFLESQTSGGGAKPYHRKEQFASSISDTKISIIVRERVSTSVNTYESVGFDKFSLFPNPASDLLSVEFKDNNQNIEIYDEFGRKVYIPEINRTDKLVSFNTSSLTHGIYWIRVGGQTQKIVIVK